MTKIGFDFGKTIGVTDDKIPYKNSFNVIKMIIDNLGPENVYIISKARIEMKEKINQWLIDKRFFDLTNFSISNVYFVDEYEDKRILVDKLQINIFVDDSVKIIRCLIDSPFIKKLVWFNGNPKLIKDLPSEYRNKIIISHQWGKLYKIIKFF